MNFFQSLAKSIGRAFTLPRKQRQALQANPILVALGSIALAEAQAAANTAIAQRVKDPAATALLQGALAHVIEQSGIAATLPAAAPASSSDPVAPAK